MGEGRMWTLVIPAPCEWLTANRDRGRFGVVRPRKMWRQASYTAALAAKLPKGLDRVIFEVEARFAGPPPVRDRDNLRPTVKAVIDGLGPARLITRNGRRYYSPGYGLIRDDSDRHVADTPLTIGPPMPARPYGPAGQLRITIREIIQ